MFENGRWVMRSVRGITPIISVVLLLMMTVAVAGLAWFWLQGMTTSTMGATENMTKTQMQQMLTIIDIADYGVACNTTGAVVNITLQVFNKGSTTIDVNSVVINGKNNAVATSIAPGSIQEVLVTSAQTYVPGLTNTTTKPASVLLSSAQGYVTKTISFNGARCNQ